MNKELFDGLPADEQHVAARLNSVSENMKVPQAFQWTLESQLMDAYQNKSQPSKGWFLKLIVPAAWTLAAVLGIFLLTWAIRSLVPSVQTQPAAPNTEIPVETFESKVRQGNICEGPLAVAHGFSVALTNDDKTAFLPFPQEEPGSELRTFVWSTDGKQLAVLGNIRGSGNIYVFDATSHELLNVLANPDFGYLYEFGWSRDGKQFAMWSTGDNQKIFLVKADASGGEEKQLGVYISSAPLFAPDGKSIFFVGSNSSTFGLFEYPLDGSEIRQISKLVEDESGFALSPDGTRLAFMDMDRISGGAVLMIQDLETDAVTPLPGGLSIPKGSGSSIPNVANMSWSQDGTKIVFEFGRSAQDRAIYIANADGSGMVKVVESAHAPSISADGNCLAYISGKQVFLLDLSVPLPEPILLTDLPDPRGTVSFSLDKLQWQP